MNDDGQRIGRWRRWRRAVGRAATTAAVYPFAKAYQWSCRVAGDPCPSDWREVVADMVRADIRKKAGRGEEVSTDHLDDLRRFARPKP